MLWEIEDDVLYKYNGDPDVEEVHLPDEILILDVEEMLAKSFHHLKIVHLPEKVPYISAEFFYGTSELTHIFIHPGNWYYKDIDGVLIDKENNLLLYYPAGRVG